MSENDNVTGDATFTILHVTAHIVFWIASAVALTFGLSHLGYWDIDLGFLGQDSRRVAIAASWLGFLSGPAALCMWLFSYVSDRERQFNREQSNADGDALEELIKDAEAEAENRDVGRRESPMASDKRPRREPMATLPTDIPGMAMLTAADYEFSRSRYMSGAHLVWTAAMTALAAAADRHGLPCRSREEAWQFVKYLDDRAERLSGGCPHCQSVDSSAVVAATGCKSTRRHVAGFSLSESFREQYENQDELKGSEFQWDPDEFAIFLDAQRGFIADLNCANLPAHWMCGYA